MIRVTVSRPPGRRKSEDITEALLSGSRAAATARANAELDARGGPRERVTIEIDPQSGLQVNSLAEIVETRGQRWRGLIDGITMELRAEADDTGRMTITRSCTVAIERESEG